MGHTYTKKKQVFLVCLEFKFNYATCVLSDNSTYMPKVKQMA